jgi:hypothetical protein
MLLKCIKMELAVGLDIWFGFIGSVTESGRGAVVNKVLNLVVLLSVWNA